MPPLVSEDLDEQSSIDAGTPSTEETTVEVAGGEPRPTLDEPAQATEREQNAPLEVQNMVLDPELFIQIAPVSEDYALGEQLQRSAEEGLSDQDAETAADADEGVETIVAPDRCARGCYYD